MKHAEQSRWAKALTNNEPNVSIYKPPSDLYRLWRENKSEITSTSKISKAKQQKNENRSVQNDFNETMKGFMTFQQQMTQIKLQESMANSMSNLTNRTTDAPQHQAPQVSSYPPPPPQYHYPHFAYPHPAPTPPLPSYSPHIQASQSSYLTSASQPIQSTQPARSAAPPLIRTRKSSPINPDIEDEVLIDAFFNWKKTRASDTRRQRITRIQQIVEDQEWSIDDLKMMVDSHSTPYRVTIEKGISDGAARGFKAELTQFTVYWRQTAQRLLNMADGGGDGDA